MRNRTRRSFTVEVKSAARRQAAVFPDLVEPPAEPARPAPRAPRPEAAAPPAEPRRILPNLLAAEAAEAAEAEPAPDDAPLPQRRRGRPRKVPGDMPRARPEAEVETPAPPVAEPVAVPVPAMPAGEAPPSPPAKRSVKRIGGPDTPLAPGERWKRRLGRWSR